MGGLATTLGHTRVAGLPTDEVAHVYIWKDRVIKDLQPRAQGTAGYSVWGSHGNQLETDVI